MATAGPMPDQVTDAQLAAMTATPTRPVTGALVGVDIPVVSRVDGPPAPQS